MRKTVKQEIIIDFVKREFKKNVSNIYTVGNKKRVWCIECSDGTKLRYDHYHKKYIKLQMLVWSKGLNVPKVLKEVDFPQKTRFCEWIEGKLIREMWREDEVFIKAGELMAQINNIRCPTTKKYITNSDFNPSNLVWTKDKKLYMIDFNTAKKWDSPKDVDRLAASCIAKYYQYWPKWADQNKEKKIRGPRKKMELFLEGYQKYRDTKQIVRLLNKCKWQFNKQEFIQYKLKGW